MQCSVVVPTFRRSTDLTRCLRALAGQRSPATEVVVVIRPDDAETLAVLIGSSPGIRRVFTYQPGVVAAMNAGLAAATGDVIALTDDDAAPWPDWLERIERHFAADPQLGVIGGRDWQYKGDPLTLDDGQETRCGELQWHGRVIGQHHWAAAGPPREVAIVKGVNMAFRAEALRAVGGFDTRLAGSGAQVHWELGVCLAIRRAGWKVVFDPALGVDHFPADRFDEDQRGRFNAVAQRNMVFNETLLLAEHLRGLRRVVFLTWALAVGTRGAPGILQWFRLRPHDRHAGSRLWSTLSGRLAGGMAALRPTRAT